jgi:poly(A) polymerase
MNPETRRKLVGAPTFPIELELHRLDRLCASGDMETYDFLKDFVASLDNGPALPDPWVSGNDILGLGLARGPAVGAWHRRAYDEQLSGRHGDRDALLRWLQQELQTETDTA